MAIAIVGLSAGSSLAETAVRSAIVDNRAVIQSLQNLTIATLRQRSFAARFKQELSLGPGNEPSAHAQPNALSPHAYMSSYLSDGLKVYARIVLPALEPKGPTTGFPVVLFAHGWVGEARAPQFDFASGLYYKDLIEHFVESGYVVIVPGYRGHGAVNGIPAQGLEFIHAYDNGSYLAPIFYGIDLLYALQAVPSLNSSNGKAKIHFRVDIHRIYLLGHSQGGDAALTALAVSSSSKMKTHIAAAAMWSGCVGGRIEQGAFYGPMKTSEAALKDPAYFPLMPPDWDRSQYSGTIQKGIDAQRTEMVDTIHRYVADQSRASGNSLFGIMSKLDAARFPQYIDVPLDLHYSDSDYFSPPAWNAAIVRSIRAAGGQSTAYVYPGNTHELQITGGWSPSGSVAGRELAMARTLALFR